MSRTIVRGPGQIRPDLSTQTVLAKVHHLYEEIQTDLDKTTDIEVVNYYQGYADACVGLKRFMTEKEER